MDILWGRQRSRLRHMLPQVRYDGQLYRLRRKLDLWYPLRRGRGFADAGDAESVER